MAQHRSTDYEYFMQTKNVPSGTTVVFAAVSNELLRWDEFKYLDSGSDSVVVSIYENSNACGQGHDYDQGGTIEEPSIGYLNYRIKIVNPGKNAYVNLTAEGDSFITDIYFTYDWNIDKFFIGGNCNEYGTTGIEDNKIITHVDNGKGNLLFQPTDPLNLSLTVVNYHPVLIWNASLPTFSKIKYRVQRKPFGGSWFTIADITDTTYTDSELSTTGRNRIWYDYRIQAHTNKNSPGYSNVVGIRGSLNSKQLNNNGENDEFLSDYQLLQNHPNPFNPSTIIQYALPEESSVSLVIYDLMGKEISNWTYQNEPAGYQQITWNGTDRNGKRVPAGIYIYKLTARSNKTYRTFSQNRKLVLLK